MLMSHLNSKPTPCSPLLERESLGARGLEHFARNTTCLRLGVLTMLGISPVQAVQELYNEPASQGQSPFAMHVGNRFEELVFEEDARRLVELYVRKDRLSSSQVHVLDVAAAHPGTSLESLAARHALTLQTLEDLLARPLPEATLLIHPRLHLKFLEQTIDIEPDAILVMPETSEVIPVEIKSYADREGYTSTQSIRSACRQAAVGIAALRQDFGSDLAARVDLILRKPTHFVPTLRPMTLEGEVESIEQAIAHAPALRERILELLHEDELHVRDRGHLERLPNHFCEECKEHCALAPLCKREAFRGGESASLGSQARESLRAVGSIPEAWALLRGERDPKDAQEVALLAQLRELEEAFMRVHPQTPETGGHHGC